ncbi:uncharacterized protein A1O5_00186 [Cladophialophora psammophila CBS 110553]|uniref:F-box domain-containing protein n=1 Tax=Cladophialophora psammophila CBS 110553 TaxID=1182543 RepID=W9XZH7_9EURO|nr:uncharacterized protein A1O5_00186 [Cladophialophora psammophila CBS 110553]EXJ75679.1 hypothetical protein A1O5_00186 [Cladophialophora psammophila CBS 110553]
MTRVAFSVGFSLLARPKRRCAPPDPSTAPRVIRRHAKFAVPHRILSGRARRRRQIRTQNASSIPKLRLWNLPTDLQLEIMDHLDKPSRIVLGLTSKHFADITSLSKTDLTDRPSLVEWRTPGPNSERRYTPHISDRRILMLQLETYFPRNRRLCWICLKYTPIKKSKWHATSRVNTVDGNHIDLPFLRERPVRRVWAHERCMNLKGWTHGHNVGAWAVRTAGVAGGRDTYYAVNSRLPPASQEVYKH